MALVEKPKTKISDFFNPITNPGGGAKPFQDLFGGLFKAPPATLGSYMTPRPTAQGSYGAPMTPIPQADRDRIAARPVAPAASAPVSPVPTPYSAGPSRAPVGTQGATGAAPASQNPEIPRSWVKADGTIKTPEEVAADVALTLKGSAGVGDIGKLAATQFEGAGKSAVDLEADARRIGNTRNDIAVGETDPYKVASQSGIAYTPAELKAIENAYAGIYDPALDTALAKVEQKREEDNMRLQSELDSNKPYTLGKNDVRYDGKGNILAVGQGDAPSAGSGQYVAGANATVDAFVQGIRTGVYKPSDIPDEYKAAVAQGMSATRPAISQSSTEAVSVINQLLGKNLEDISGFRITDPSSLFPGTAVQSTMNLAKQIKGMLSLENRDMLKGSGAISDFEFRVLGDASSALGIDEGGRTNLSPEEFKAELEKLQLKLLVGETELTDDELLYLRDEKGYTPDQIRQYNQQSFSGVGNTTASTGQGNRPQRNNNPGNVKAGGLADSLAVGTDDQGHLVFPDAASGFKALTMDLTAKIGGSSRYLPPNPTLAQLGKVYAEDSNWPVAVARMLGVSTNTPTQSIPFDKLVKAVATQEGFYA